MEWVTGVKCAREKKGIEPSVLIPPTRFELVSPDPKSCMIDRYTTGVHTDETTTIAIFKVVSIHKNPKYITLCEGISL